MDIKILSPEQTLETRRAVLWPDQRLQDVALPEDKHGLHLGKFNEDHRLVGVISLFFDPPVMTLKKFAVQAAFQSKGIGSTLLIRAKQIALSKGCQMAACDAREHSMPFYARHGFEVERALVKYGRPYLRMVCRL